jgi:hypothetical protein
MLCLSDFLATDAEVGIDAGDTSSCDVSDIIEVYVGFIDVELVFAEEVKVVFLFLGLLDFVEFGA